MNCKFSAPWFPPAPSPTRAACPPARPPPQAGAAAGEPITLAEEASLVKFYEAKVQSVCRELRLPRKVLGTAVTYLKRFYAAASALDHHPLPIALACLYLACKAEECYLSAAELGRLSGTPAEVLLRQELPVLQGLGFDLLVHTPHRAVDGCFAEVEACRGGGGGGGEDDDVDGLRAVGEEAVGRARAAAYAAADALLLTDAPLLHTPGQLGLAATRSGFNKVGVKLQAFVGRAARRALPEGAPAAAAQRAQRRLAALLAQVDALGAAGSAAVPQEEAAAIDRKLKACRSPLLDASSEAAQAAAAGKAAAKAAKAERKAARRADAQAGREAEVGVGPLGAAPAGLQASEAEGQPQQRKRAREPC